jgi:hypothetical protein
MDITEEDMFRPLSAPETLFVAVVVTGEEGAPGY